MLAYKRVAKCVAHHLLCRRLGWLACLVLWTCLSHAFATPCFAGDAAPAGMPSDDAATMRLAVGQQMIEVEVAATADKRAEGLMHRQSMPLDHGMLFAFPNSARFCMWMRNTLIPLSVAFLDEAGRILNIEDMLPQTDTPHCAVKNARYALEMNGGWFRRQGVGAGAKLKGLNGKLSAN